MFSNVFVTNCLFLETSTMRGVSEYSKTISDRIILMAYFNIHETYSYPDRNVTPKQYYHTDVTEGAMHNQ